MAANPIRFYILDAAAAGSSHGSLTVAVPANVGATGLGTGFLTGNTVGVSSDAYALMTYGSKVAAGTFNSTPQPASAPTTNDCWRTTTGGDGSGKFNGTFAAGNHTIDLGAINPGVGTSNGQWRVRIWASVNADMSSAREITSGATNGVLYTSVGSSETDNTFTINLPAFTANSEYLGLQVACFVPSGQQGTASTAEFDFVTLTFSNVGGVSAWQTTAFTPSGSETIPFFVAAGTQQGSTGAITVPWPAGHATGDIGLLIVESANQAITLTTPNGFVQVTNSPQGTGTAAGTAATLVAVYWCRATSGAMASPVVADAGDHTIGSILTFRNCIPSGNPWNITAGGTAAASTAVSVPGATTTANGCLVVLIANNPVDSGSDQSLNDWANSNLANIFQVFSGNNISGNGGGTTVATGMLQTAKAYGSSTSTRASSTVQALMSIALAGVVLEEQYDPNTILVGERIASAVADGAAASALLYQSLRFNDDIFNSTPAAPIQDEDFWSNLVAPIQNTLYQPLPFIPDPEEIPAGSLHGIPEEFYWINAVTPIPSLPAYAPAFRDPEEIPAGLLFGVPTEEYWINGVAPVIATLYQPLPTKDPDEIPAGLLFGVPDELYWANLVAPLPSLFFQRLPLGEQDDFVAPVVTSVEEDFWVNAVPPVPAALFQRLPVGEQDDLPAGALFGVPDEVFWINPVAPVPASLYQPLPFKDPEELPAGRFFGQDDEDFWVNAVPPSPMTFFQRLPLGDQEELPAGALHAVPDELHWSSGVAPMQATLYQPLPFKDQDEIPAGVLHGQPDEDFWVNSVAPVVQTFFQRLPIGDQDEIPAGRLFGVPEEHYWTAPATTASTAYAALSLVDVDIVPFVPPTPGQPEDDAWVLRPAPGAQAFLLRSTYGDGDVLPAHGGGDAGFAPTQPWLEPTRHYAKPKIVEWKTKATCEVVVDAPTVHDVAAGSATGTRATCRPVVVVITIHRAVALAETRSEAACEPQRVTQHFARMDTVEVVSEASGEAWYTTAHVVAPESATAFVAECRPTNTLELFNLASRDPIGAWLYLRKKIEYWHRSSARCPCQWRWWPRFPPLRPQG